MSKELYVAAPREQAQAECFPFIRAKYDAYRDWGQDTVLPPGESFEGAMAELTAARTDPLASDAPCAPALTLTARAAKLGRMNVRRVAIRWWWPG